MHQVHAVFRWRFDLYCLLLTLLGLYLQVFGRDWARLQEAVPKKTMTQIKNYYQNYKLKVNSPQ